MLYYFLVCADWSKMSNTRIEPPQKRAKLSNDAKCIQCSGFLRKYPAENNITIKTREKANFYHENYGIFVQVNDTICGGCFAKLRVAKSRSNRKSLAANESSQIQRVPGLER